MGRKRAVALLAATAAAILVPEWDALAQTLSPAPPSAATPTAAAPPVVELAKALAWPIVALALAAIFRRPITVFFSALGSRITKLSLFKVELELLPATPATVSPLLDDIRTATSRAEISDSSRAMLEQVQSDTPADFALIALGTGDEWLTSRLYIAAAMMQRMRGVRAFVFVEQAPTTQRRLVAVASVRQLRWALARKYPWLEAAFVVANLGAFPLSTIPAAALPPQAAWLPDPRTLTPHGAPPLITSDTGGLQPWQARELVGRFIESLQQVDPPKGPQDPLEWVLLGTSTYERAAWVTRGLLASLLPQEAFRTYADALRDAPRARRTRAVLRRAAPFVALVDADREFIRLVNRNALLEEIAGSLGEEPEEKMA